MENEANKYPEKHFLGMWIGLGIAIFSGFGIPLSIATNNPGLIGIGPALGVAFGVAIGQSIENRYKKEGKIRPLTEREQNRFKTLINTSIAILLIGVYIFLLLLILSNL